MSSLVDTQKERVYCLESALRLDPMNTTAMRGLVLLGARNPQTGPLPLPLVHRKWWSASDEELDGSRSRVAVVISHPAFKFVSFIGIGLIVVALILVGIYGFRNATRSKGRNCTGNPARLDSGARQLNAHGDTHNDTGCAVSYAYFYRSNTLVDVARSNLYTSTSIYQHPSWRKRGLQRGHAGYAPGRLCWNA